MASGKINYILYDTVTGEIIQTGITGENDTFDWIGANESAMEGMANDAVEYVDVVNKVVISKEDQIASIDKTALFADGVDSIVISGVEIGTNIFINKALAGVTTDGEITLTFDAAGQYTIKLVVHPFLNKEFIVSAN